MVTDRASSRPEAVAAEFVEAWNRRDPDALAALFDEDAEFVNVTGLWWHTRNKIRSAHAYGLTRIFKDSSLQASTIVQCVVLKLAVPSALSCARSTARF